MCDQTEVSYLPGDIVWVKLGPVWWPGKVCGNDEVPPEVLKELRKTPIAIVKFFQEESFEYVKKLTNIYHYNCLRKNEFIKKGLDMCRSSNRDTPSNMKLFPEDIATAEVLTDGNPNIIHDEMFLPEKKPSYAADFVTTPKKTPKKIKIERRKETPSSKPLTPRVITHPRFIRHGICDYEARERKQVPLRAECDEEDNSPPTTYRCTDCEFTTIRLNVMVLHNKSHVRNYAHQHVNKGVKRKSTSAVKFKERKTADRESSEYVKPAKVPKSSEKPKFRTPHKKSLAKKRSVEKETGGDQVVEPVKPIVKKKRLPVVADEIQNSLLQDWEDFENEQENELRPNEDSNSYSGDFNDSTASSSRSNDKTDGNKSCFDFDDSEDGLVIDKSKIRLGRKIPRVLDDSKADKNDSLEVEEDSTASSGLQSNDIDASNASDTNENGIDSADDSFAETHKTSQLQEMGVDNEIEIDSEDVRDGDSNPANGNETETECKVTQEAEKSEQEAEELKQKVEKLLEEITPAPKLPEMPYSVKKAHIKSFNESEELARREAEKNLATSSEPVPKPEPVESQIEPEPSEPQIEPASEPSTAQQDDEQSKESCSDTIEETTEPLKQEIVECEPPKAQDDQPSSPVKSEPPCSSPEENTPQPEVIENNTAAPIKVVVESVPSATQSIVVTLPAATTPTTPVKALGSPVKITTTPKFKIINQSPLIKVGSGVVKNPTIINKLQTSDGKKVVCFPLGAQSPQKFKSLILNPDSTKKSIILNSDAAKKLLNSPNTTIKLPTTAIPGARAATGQKVRLTFNPTNILQKTPRSPAPKSPAKSIVLPSNLQTGNVVLLQPQKPIVISGVATSDANVSSTSAQPDSNKITYLTNDGKSYQIVGGATSTTELLTMDLNQSNNVFITDPSGNLIPVPEGNPGCVTAKEDILAKALENTDVLQTEITLKDASQSVLDTISVAQNTPITFKSDTVYETNLTLNTPPIMSAYETPSRALNSSTTTAGTTVPENVSNEMIIISSGTENDEYVV